MGQAPPEITRRDRARPTRRRRNRRAAAHQLAYLADAVIAGEQAQACAADEAGAAKQQNGLFANATGLAGCERYRHA